MTNESLSRETATEVAQALHDMAAEVVGGTIPDGARRVATAAIAAGIDMGLRVALADPAIARLTVTALNTAVYGGDFGDSEGITAIVDTLREIVDWGLSDE